MFNIGQTYKKDDIYKLLNVPEDRQRGAWDKGLRKYENQFFIFANIGISGRTGHDYDNYWDGDLLFWQAANDSTTIQPQVKELLTEKLPVFIFTRTHDKDPFTYEGKGKVEHFENTSPVRVVWKFIAEDEKRNEILPEEIRITDDLTEGIAKKIFVNKYERNPEARRQCIAHHGAYCQICKFNFEEEFGILGKDYIHVHHTKLLSAIGKEYVVDPIKDLIPVCPNCHAMLHKTNPPLSIDELRSIKKL